MTHSLKIDDTVWIGIAHVVPEPGNDSLGSSKGAYVNLIALVDNEIEFRRLTEQFLKKLEFDVLDLFDIEQFDSRQSKVPISKELVDLRQHLSKKCPVGCTAFDSYAEE